MTESVERITHKFACIDRVPEGVDPIVSQSQLKKMTEKKIQDSILQGKLSSSNRKKVEKQTFTKLKASFIKDAIWPTNQPIRIHFMDGDERQRSWVKKVVQEKLEPVISKLKFIWDVPLRGSDIRITFRLPGQAWSYIGTQNKLSSPTEETMSLGWLDDDVQYDSPQLRGTGVVVLHEFCHMLGMIHEHQNPKGNKVVWNKPLIYQKLASTNGWDKQTVDNNIFKKYGDSELCEETKNKPHYEGKEFDLAGYCGGEEVNGSEYDVYSIMHYFYPPEWILEGPSSIPKNTKLSDMDKLWLAKYYGDPTQYEIPSDSVNSNSMSQTSTSTTEEKIEDELDALMTEMQTIEEGFTLRRSPRMRMYMVLLWIIAVALYLWLER